MLPAGRNFSPAFQPKPRPGSSPQISRCWGRMSTVSVVGRVLQVCSGEAATFPGSGGSCGFLGAVSVLPPEGFPLGFQVPIEQFLPFGCRAAPHKRHTLMVRQTSDHLQLRIRRWGATRITSCCRMRLSELLFLSLSSVRC